MEEWALPGRQLLAVVEGVGGNRHVGAAKYGEEGTHPHSVFNY